MERVQAVEEVLRRLVELLAYAGDDDPERAARPQERRELGQIRVVGAEVVERVEAHDRVEVLVRERQAVRFAVDREHAIVQAGGVDAGRVLGR